MPTIYLPYITSRKGGTYAHKKSDVSIRKEWINGRYIIYVYNKYTDTRYDVLNTESEAQADGERLRLGALSEEKLMSYVSYNRLV